MRRLSKFAIVVFSGLAVSAVYATDYKVDEICAVQASNASNTVYIQPCGGWASRSSCNHGNYIEWDASTFQGQAMYASAMTALVAGKSVTVRLNSNDCESFDKTQMIRINK